MEQNFALDSSVLYYLASRSFEPNFDGEEVKTGKKKKTKKKKTKKKHIQESDIPEEDTETTPLLKNFTSFDKTNVLQEHLSSGPHLPCFNHLRPQEIKEEPSQTVKNER